MAILREFKVAFASAKIRDITNFRILHPSPTNTLTTFTFNRSTYAILEDGDAHDNTNYIASQVKIAYPNEEVEVLASPLTDIMTYGLPYRNKDVYLIRQISRKKRLDICLAELYPEHSRSTWQKYITNGHVSVNGKPITSPKYEVEDIDNISINLPPKKDYSNHELPVLYLDNDVIVIDKPCGVLTHSKGEAHDEFTVADFVQRYNIDQATSNRTGIVHRLDRDTSGIIIAARTEKAAAFLKKQFASRHVRKTYLAVLSGIPKLPKAVIDVPIGRNPAAPSQFRTDSKGKSAQTSYEVLRMSDGYSLIRLHPKTGRTHQLRVHMAHIGTPIHGDRIYGQSANRMYLHATQLEVTLPSGTDTTFNSDMPPEFKSIVG